MAARRDPAADHRGRTHRTGAGDRAGGRRLHDAGHPQAGRDGALGLPGHQPGPPAARRAVLRGPHRHGQDRAGQGRRLGAVRQRPGIPAFRHERVLLLALGGPPGGSPARVRGVRGGRRADDRGARQSVPGDPVRRDREGRQGSARQVPPGAGGRQAHRRAGRHHVLQRVRADLHLQSGGAAHRPADRGTGVDRPSGNPVPGTGPDRAAEREASLRARHRASPS